MPAAYSPAATPVGRARRGRDHGVGRDPVQAGLAELLGQTVDQHVGRAALGWIGDGELALPLRLHQVRPGCRRGQALELALVDHQHHHVHVGADPQVVRTAELGRDLVQVGRAVRLQVLAVGAQRAEAAAPEQVAARVLRLGLDALHHGAGAARDRLHAQRRRLFLDGFQRRLDGLGVVGRVQHHALGPAGAKAASRPDCSRCLICMASLPGTGYLPEKSLMRNAFTDTMMGSTITVTSAAP